MSLATNEPYPYEAAVITPLQIKAARALLGWTQQDLADHAHISIASINNLERGVADPRFSTLTAIDTAFRLAGVRFLEPGSASLGGGMGVRLES